MVRKDEIHVPEINVPEINVPEKDEWERQSKRKRVRT